MVFLSLTQLEGRALAYLVFILIGNKYAVAELENLANCENLASCFETSCLREYGFGSMPLRLHNLMYTVLIRILPKGH